MFKINLTSAVLLVVIAFLVFFLARVYGDKQDYKEAYKQQEASFVLWENKIVTEYKAEKKVLRDSLDFFRELHEANQEQADIYRARIKLIQADLATVKSQVSKVTPDSSYAYLKGPEGILNEGQYRFTKPEVKGLHATDLENEKRGYLIKDLEKEGEYLRMNSITAGDMIVTMQSELDACDQAIEKLELDYQEKEFENKKLKRRVWNNRGLVGVLGIGLILVLL